MNEKVAQLAPSEVWTWFEKLNAVPRPSKKEERVIAFIQGVGAELDLETLTDDAGNVCLLYTSPSPRDKRQSRMPSSA